MLYFNSNFNNPNSIRFNIIVSMLCRKMNRSWNCKQSISELIFPKIVFLMLASPAPEIPRYLIILIIALNHFRLRFKREILHCTSQARDISKTMWAHMRLYYNNNAKLVRISKRKVNYACTRKALQVDWMHNIFLET